MHDLTHSHERMSTLHSCHWDCCRFTTVLHDDFVRHVIEVHIDKAEPIKREDINLIQQVEQCASGHTDNSEPLIASYHQSIILFIGGVLSVEVPAGSRVEAPQSTTQSVQLSVSLVYPNSVSFLIICTLSRQIFRVYLDQQTLKWPIGHCHLPLVLPASSQSLHRGSRQVALKTLVEVCFARTWT
jgi:hypothetical protein